MGAALIPVPGCKGQCCAEDESKDSLDFASPRPAVEDQVSKHERRAGAKDCEPVHHEPVHHEPVREPVRAGRPAQYEPEELARFKTTATLQRATVLVGVWRIVDKDKEVEIRMKTPGAMKVFWDKCYNYSPSDINDLTNDSIEMVLAGAKHEALLEQGPPAELRWSDGEVWTKSQHEDTIAPIQLNRTIPHIAQSAAVQARCNQSSDLSNKATVAAKKELAAKSVAKSALKK